MLRRMISGILALLLIGVLTSAFNIQLVNAESRTWTVDDNGPADFHTIQEAINHASEGDSIFVKTGTYNENVIINKTISLIGEKSETTKIYGTETGPAIYIEANNIVVKGFTFEVPTDTRYSSVRLYGSSGGFFINNVVLSGFFGIYMSRCKNTTIKDNECNANFDYGILVGHSSNNVIRSNNVTYTWYGIGLWSSSSNIVDSNNIMGTGRGGGYPTSFEPAGILLWNYSSKNEVIGNKIYNNKHNGISIVLFSTDNLIINNVVSNNWHYSVWLEENSTGNTFYHNLFDDQKQVYIQNGSNVWNCDYPCGGNYWSDYSGVDFYSGPYQNETGSDGIGDTPYIIDENNRDNYPLMEPWDINPPFIDTPFQEPDDVMSNQVVKISVNVSDAGSGVKNVILSYTAHGGISWTNLTMFYNSTCLLYQAAIPAFSAGTHVCYKIIACDNADNVAMNDNAGQYYCYTVRSLAKPPVANFNWSPSIPKTGELVTFNASGSLPGWNGTHEMLITEYRWDFGDGNKTTTSTPIIYHKFISSGIYYVTSTVYALGATPETNSTTHKVTVITIPVGGYSSSIEGYTTAKPLTLYLSQLAILTVIIAVIKRKTHKRKIISIRDELQTIALILGDFST